MVRVTILEQSAIDASMEKLPAWSCVTEDGVVRIQRAYRFEDHAAATAFVQLLGELADLANHHPSTLVQRQCVTVAWWTFMLGGLTKFDFTMAERSDRLYEALGR